VTLWALTDARETLEQCNLKLWPCRLKINLRPRCLKICSKFGDLMLNRLWHRMDGHCYVHYYITTDKTVYQRYTPWAWILNTTNQLLSDTGLRWHC